LFPRHQDGDTFHLKSSYETSISVWQLHGVTPEKIVIFLVNVTK